MSADDDSFLQIKATKQATYVAVLAAIGYISYVMTGSLILMLTGVFVVMILLILWGHYFGW